MCFYWTHSLSAYIPASTCSHIHYTVLRISIKSLYISYKYKTLNLKKCDTFISLIIIRMCVCIFVHVCFCVSPCVCVCASHILSCVCRHTRRQEPPIKTFFPLQVNKKPNTRRDNILYCPFVLIERKLSSPGARSYKNADRIGEAT